MSASVKNTTQKLELSNVVKTKRGAVCVGQVFSKDINIHGYYFDEEKRERVFGVVGKQAIYDDIQSHRAECDMTFIKEHLLENSTDVIDESLFADVSDLTGDLLTNLVHSRLAEDRFKSLPIAVREKYGNDIYRFAREFKLEDFVQKNKNITSEVKKDEIKE